MRTQFRQASTTLLLALVTVGLLGGVADAGETAFIERGPGATSTEPIPEGAILATPEDVASSGGTAEEVAAQEAVWAALPANVARQQRRLIAREEARLRELQEHAGAAPKAGASSGSITPMAGQVNCASGSYQSFYKVRQGSKYQCFAGSAGVTNLNPMFTYVGLSNVDIQAGGYAGRTKYTVWNTWYNTEWRGPEDYTWRTLPDWNYDQFVRVRSVQIQSDW